MVTATERTFEHCIHWRRDFALTFCIILPSSDTLKFSASFQFQYIVCLAYTNCHTFTQTAQKIKTLLEVYYDDFMYVYSHAHMDTSVCSSFPTFK